MATVLGSALDFFKEFGLFDIVLPFLLVFTLVFAILEKTKILGTEGSDGKTPKKNLNAMVSFVVGLLVVATNKVVTTINAALPNIILLLVLLVFFLVLIGVFWKDSEMDFIKQHKALYGGFVAVIIIAIIAIFLGAVPHENTTLLAWIWDYIITNWGNAVISSIIILVVIIGAMFLVVKSGSKSGGKSE